MSAKEKILELLTAVVKQNNELIKEYYRLTPEDQKEFFPRVKELIDRSDNLSKPLTESPQYEANRLIKDTKLPA